MVCLIQVSDEIDSLDMSSLNYERVTGSGVNASIRGIAQLVKWTLGITNFERKSVDGVTSGKSYFW